MPPDRKIRTAVERVDVTDLDEELVMYDVGCECGFASIGWPSKKLATARRDQHVQEHRTGKPAPPKNDLLETRADQDAATRIALALQRAREGRG